eukprot:scaffold260568_cov32-Tisochrysis_lutea.AAC.3
MAWIFAPTRAKIRDALQPQGQCLGCVSSLVKSQSCNPSRSRGCCVGTCQVSGGCLRTNHASPEIV